MSEIIIVEKEGFPVISEKHEYGIRGNFYNQIYKFFKKYEPGKLYILSSEMLEDGLAKYVDVNMEQYYNMYGIYFRDGILNKINLWMAPIPRDIFVKNDNAAIEEYLDEYAERYNLREAEIGICVVEMEVSEQKDYIRNLISEGDADNVIGFYDSYSVANYDFGLQVYKNDNDYYVDLQKQYAGKKLINFAKIMIKHNCAALRERSVIIASYKNTIDDIVETATDNTVYYYAPYAKDIEQKDRDLLVRANGKFGRMGYVNLAAYLALKHGIKFDIPDGFEAEYLAALQSMCKPSNMYACDYLNSLKNPPAIAVLCRDNGYAFLYQRTKSAKDLYSITVAMSEIEESDSGFSLCNNDVETTKLNAFSTEILKITDYYDMHTYDYKHGLAEMQRLQKLTDAFQKLLTSKDIIKLNMSLDCSNTVILRYAGKLYVAYLMKKDVLYHYKTRPIAKGYTEYDSATVNENTLRSLIDMRAFTDYDLLIKKESLARLPQISDTAIGVITQLGTTNQESVSESCGLPFDTVCLWDRLVSSFRAARVARISTSIPVMGLRKDFLTFFGGPHPCRGGSLESKPTLTLERSLWAN